MFICEFNGGHQSGEGESEKLIVTEWRAKVYASKELPPLPGTNVRRWTKPGEGFEAAVVKKACPACAGTGVKNALTPREFKVVPVVASPGLALAAA